MTLNELIKLLQKLQSEGYGEKKCTFDDFYNIKHAEYDKEEDRISVY